MSANLQPLYYNQLSKDTVLAPLLDTVVPYELQKRNNVCVRLCASIMGQQLSVKVAAVIYSRFLEIYSGQEPLPQQILDTSFEVLRGIGLSNAKVGYVQNVAGFMLEHNITDESLEIMGNEDIINLLTNIKGVGRWTVEMLLMFTLGREDVFAADDLGIQQAMIKLYSLDAASKKQLKEQMLQVSAKWAPHRTYACFYLWKYKDGF